MIFDKMCKFVHNDRTKLHEFAAKATESCKQTSNRISGKSRASKQTSELKIGMEWKQKKKRKIRNERNLSVGNW